MTKTKNALTKELWTESEGFYLDPDQWIYGDSSCHSGCCVEDRHAMAAVCLHGQDFGFSHEMVRALRDLGHFNQTREDQDLAHRAIGNIEALLPPETQTEEDTT